MAKSKIKIPTAFDQRPDATGPINVTLPILPPSANELFVEIPGKGRVKTAKYNHWIAQAGMLLKSQCRERMVGRANVNILIEDRHPRRDGDNFCKPICDLLVRVGVLKDDSAKYVRSTSVTWADVDGLNIQVWPAVVGAP